MQIWNSLSLVKRGLLLGLGAGVLFVAAVFLALDLRCGLVNNFIACSRQESVVTLQETATSTPSLPLSEAPDRPEPIALSGPNSLAVNDQPAGPIVEVNMITLSYPGWVVVYESNNNQLGKALGAGRFEEGIHLGEIELLRSTEPNKSYYVVLHADTEGREFDLKKNPKVKDEEGRIIEAGFRTFSE